ncbi:MAG: hypothetical protein LBG65_07710 [Puniceicoccales bacterium]|jgi:[protein-PII] uridylyltransferase|nr:hypothetical protein [Puniceicoccales bacterium]
METFGEMAGTRPHNWLARFREHARRRGLADPGLRQEEWLQRAKVFLRLERGLLLRNHRLGMSGLEIVRWRATVIDVFLENVHARVLHDATPGERDAVAFVAHGGYGRGELCPFSDIDLMLIYDETALPPDTLAALLPRVSENTVRLLWDAGLKPGHASRTIAQSVADARADAVTRNTLLDTRLVAGNPDIVARLREATFGALRHGGTTEAIRFLIAAREERLARHGNSVFMQEPDIKNGAGGLRDFHTLRWFARLHCGAGADAGTLVALGFLTQDEIDAATAAYSHLLRIRNELHFESRRESNVLSLEKQKTIAGALRCAGENWMRQIENLMRGYYKAADTIRQTLDEVEWRFRELAESAAEEKAGATPAVAPTAPPEAADAPRLDGFLLRRGRLAAPAADFFKKSPRHLMSVFRTLQEYRVKPERPLLRLIRENLHLLTPKIAASETVVRCFKSILADAGHVAGTLELMFTTGVLCRFLPEFSGIRWLVQREIYHRYTVDMHTLRCLRELDAIFRHEAPELARYHAALMETDEPALPYLALLLHDIGKRHGIAGHAQTGAVMTKKILDRLGIRGAANLEITALVRDHLAMSAFWQRNDLDDPENLSAFATFAGSTQHLHYLYVLTYCDARGTSPELWNDYKSSLHRQLYLGALSHLGGRKRETLLLREQVRDELAGEIAAEEMDAHFNNCPKRYFEQYGKEDIKLHIRLINRKLRTLASLGSGGYLSPVIHWAPDAGAGRFGTVTLVTWDVEGLFFRLAGAFAVSGLDIHRAKGFVRNDHFAIDTFHVTWAGQDDGGTPAAGAGILGTPPPGDAAGRFRDAAEEAIVQKLDHEPAIRARARREFTALPAHVRKIHASLPPRPEAGSYFDGANHRTVVTVKAPDRVGLLFFLSRIFYRNGFNISFASVNTEACQATDTFYLETAPGAPDPSPERLSALVQAIEAELGGG